MFRLEFLVILLAYVHAHVHASPLTDLLHEWDVFVPPEAPQCNEASPCPSNYVCSSNHKCVSLSAAPTFNAHVSEGQTLHVQCPHNSNISSIVSASYGDATASSTCHAASSKSVVEQHCLNKPGCSVEASNAKFGDPCQGVHKSLYVTYQCQDESERVEYAENDEHQQVQVTCNPGESIQSIAFASYGTPTSNSDGTYSKSSCHAQTSRRVVNTACLSRASCKVSASNNVFGDPCYGTFKKLVIGAVCANTGTVNVDARVNEHETMNLQCPHPDMVIQHVVFASYGTPTGSTSYDFKVSPTCHAHSTKENVETRCLGKHSCEVEAKNEVHSDPCYGTFKALAVSVMCKSVPSASLDVTVNEHEILQLVCPQNLHVSSVDFSSYGTPTNEHGAFETSTCHASTSQQVVEDACLLKNQCQVHASNSVMGDPCVGTFKRLSVTAQCS